MRDISLVIQRRKVELSRVGNVDFPRVLPMSTVVNNS